MSVTVAPNADVAEALDEAKETYARRNPKSRAVHEAALKSMPGGNTRTGIFFEPFPVAWSRRGREAVG